VGTGGGVGVFVLCESSVIFGLVREQRVSAPPPLPLPWGEVHSPLVVGGLPEPVTGTVLSLSSVSVSEAVTQSDWTRWPVLVGVTPLALGERAQRN